ncbi:MAG TPA: hypothetical protein VLD64_04880 [Nitrosarchaeum sp.]|nr:hypothetical protein [Nitrosarchaeum sp.]
MSTLYRIQKQGLDENKIKQALSMLLIDRRNEFRELSDVLLRTPKSLESIQNYDEFVLNFCLEVNDAFKTWSGQTSLSINSPQKALTILRQLSRDKTTMNQLAHLLNISYTLADEFKEIYRRLK